MKLPKSICKLSLPFLIASQIWSCTPAQRNLVHGGLLGGTAGGIIGHQSEETAEGIIVGTLAGAFSAYLINQAQANADVEDVYSNLINLSYSNDSDINYQRKQRVRNTIDNLAAEHFNHDLSATEGALKAILYQRADKNGYQDNIVRDWELDDYIRSHQGPLLTELGY